MASEARTSPVTMQQVADRARVSLGTVSNVVNRPEIVSQRTRTRVLRAIDELGFVRNETARHLAYGATRTIGLVIMDLANPLFVDVARGMEDRAHEAGYPVIVCNSDEDAAKESAYLKVLEERRVSGVAIASFAVTSERLQQLRSRGTSVVLLGHRGAGPDECVVGVDELRGGELAMEHLLALGHERIAYVTSAAHVWPTGERKEGALNALRTAGKPDEALQEVTVEHLNAVHGRDAGERILGLSPRPTAVFCANDLLALGVLQVMIRHGVRVPDDMAIVGFDDIEYASAAAIPLTSVRQPGRLIGRTAAELLLAEDQNDPDHIHQHVVLPTELVVRASTIGNAP